MTKNPSCFDLIKSLNKAEKIHFKRYLAGHSMKMEPAIYLQLFNEMDKMKTYELSKLQKKFHGQQFLNHLATSFNYLYNLILSSLLNFHSQKDDQLVANKMIGYVKILLRKKLYKQCEQQIKRTKKFIDSREMVTHSYLLNTLEFNLQAFLLPKHEIENYRDIISSRYQILKKITNELIIVDLHNRLLTYMRQEVPENTELIIDDIREIEDEFLKLDNSIESGTTSYRLRYLSTLARLHFLKNEKKEAFLATKRYAEEWKNLPPVLNYDLESYVFVLNMYLDRSKEIWNADEIENWLPEFERIKTKRKDLALKCDLMKMRFKFWMYFIRADFISLNEEVNDAIELLNEIGNKIVDYFKMFMYKNLSIYYFLTGDPDNFFIYANQLFELKEIDNSLKNVYDTVKFMEIMIHYNLNHVELVKSLCLSLERKIKKKEINKQKNETELNWLRQMQKAEQIFSSRQRTDFIKELQSIQKDNYKISQMLINCWEKSIIEKQNLSVIWKRESELIMY